MSSFPRERRRRRRFVRSFEEPRANRPGGTERRQTRGGGAVRTSRRAAAACAARRRRRRRRRSVGRSVVARRNDDSRLLFGGASACLRTRREKRANGARELHCVALGLPRRTRRGTGRARTRGGRETPSAQAIVRWNKFSSAPEGSKRAGLIAVLSSSQTAGRGGEQARRATTPAVRENGIGARTRARASSSRVRAVGEQK